MQMVFQEEFFEKVDFEKNQQTTKSMKNYPACQVNRTKLLLQEKCMQTKSVWLGILFSFFLAFLRNDLSLVTLVNVYVDLVVFMRVAGTS